MEQMRANAQAAKAAAQGQPMVADGIPAGPFDLGNGQMLPPFVPSSAALARLDIATGATLFMLRINNAYGGGQYYFLPDQLQTLVDTCVKELVGARSNIVVADEKTMHQVAAQAQALASGLIVPS